MPELPPTSIRKPTDPDEPDRTGRHEGAPTPFSGDAVEAGTIIAGKYKLLQAIGEGGMGAVWMAQQIEPVKRLVALKLIKAGMDSRNVIARFEAERQALSMMDHPNIARVFDVGSTPAGRPFFVMELVKGTPITEFCDQRKLTPRQRLELFVPVCNAIQHAHQKGIIHRDIKPSNVLVALHDDKPVPKVIDFGVAKAIGTPLTEKTLHTAFEQVVGTPAYMSPEQATFNQFDIDTRSDVYTLGVLLYELLTGTTPIERERFKKTAILEMLRVVREEESPRPSTRLSSTEARASIAAVRGTEPAKLSKEFRGELDWIAMKALEKDRTRRYETANALARDVQRYLADEVVEARPPSMGYRVKKFVRRHKGRVVAGVLILLAFLGGSIGSVVIERARADTEEARADIEKARAESERDGAERKRAVLKSQQLRLGERSAGWSHEAMRELEIANAIRSGDDLRDDAATTLVGLDATLDSHSLLWPPQAGHRGVGRVAFSPDSARVLAGGWSTRTQEGIDLSPALLWDGNAASKPTESTFRGAGPVAFPDADSPLQLILPDEPRKPLTLWNVGTNKQVIDIPIPLPWPGEIREAALSADARFATASFVPAKAIGNLPEPVTWLWAFDRKAATPTIKKVSEWPGAANTLAFSPDGLLLATGSTTGEVVVRSTAEGTPVRQFTEGELPITALGFGRNYRKPSGERPAPAGPADKLLLAVGSKGGGLSVWDLRSPAPTRMNRFYGSEHDIYGVAFSPDGTTLASAGRSFGYLWDVATCLPLLRVLGGSNSRYWTEGVAFSPDGRRLAFGSPSVFSAGGLDVYRLDDDRGIRTYRGLTGVIEKTWLSPSGRWVAALSMNWQLGVWDRATGEARFIWDVPAGGTTDNSAVAFDRNDTEVVFASGERVSKWTLSSGELTDSWKVPLGFNDSLATRPGKNPLLVRRDPFPFGPLTAIRARELGPGGSLTKLYELSDIDARTVGDTYLAGDGRVLLVNLNPPGRFHNRQIRLFDGLTGKPLLLDQTVHLPKNSVGRLSATGTALFVLQAVENPSYQVYQLPDLKRLGSQSVDLIRIDDAGKRGLAFIPVNPSDNGVALYRVGEERPVVTFFAPSGNAYGISPDGLFVYWGRRYGTVCVADVNKCLEQLAPFGKR